MEQIDFCLANIKGEEMSISIFFQKNFFSLYAGCGTIVIRNMTIEVKEGLVGTPDLHVKADSRTWIDFLAKEKNLLLALLGRKIRLKGDPRRMKAFARCFPS